MEIYDFGDVIIGTRSEIKKRSDALLSRLLPPEKRSRLEKNGIRCVSCCNYLCKDCEFVFSFLKRREIRQVSFKVGKRVLSTRKSLKDKSKDCHEELESLEQVKKAINMAIGELM